MESIVIQGVFIGKVEECWGGLQGAIDKLETRREVWLGTEGLPGEEAGHPRLYDGLDRVLHHYPAEHYRHWRKLHPQQRWQQPAFGENLSTFGVNEADVCVGDLFRWGEALLEVSQPRSPCYCLGRRWNLPELPLQLQQQGRCGWFYRVRRAGMVSAGAPLELVQRHYPQLSVASLLRWFFDEPLERCGLRQMMACDALSLRWRKIAAQRLASGVVEDWTARLQGPECQGGSSVA
ncbi:MOSC domain-containing protein [Pseudomonas citronellolis]|uniref:MOSC domain-containing protein n=1 Tax=Pseudomonas citronellolis TaxID=53408 RepID=UPI0023E3C03A|nr:MOSC domain-containing protein [Pseudomonas citronellolis]MDF3935530.1 MOSC domain-containing protein [Pseudomonas citronellolis]